MFDTVMQRRSAPNAGGVCAAELKVLSPLTPPDFPLPDFRRAPPRRAVIVAWASTSQFGVSPAAHQYLFIALLTNKRISNRSPSHQQVMYASMLFKKAVMQCDRGRRY